MYPFDKVVCASGLVVILVVIVLLSMGCTTSPGVCLPGKEMQAVWEDQHVTPAPLNAYDVQLIDLVLRDYERMLK